MQNTPLMDSEDQADYLSGIFSETYRAILAVILEAIKAYMNQNKVTENDVFQFVQQKISAFTTDNEELQLLFEMFPPTDEDLHTIINQVLSVYMTLAESFDPQTLGKSLDSQWLLFLLMQLSLLSNLKSFRFLKIFRLLQRWLAYLKYLGKKIDIPNLHDQLESLISEKLSTEDALIYLSNPLSDQDLEMFITNISQIHTRLSEGLPASIAELLIQNSDIIYLIIILQNEIDSFQNLFGLFVSHENLLKSLLGIDQEIASGPSTHLKKSSQTYIKSKGYGIDTTSKLLISEQYNQTDSRLDSESKGWQRRVDSYLDSLHQAENTGDIVNRIKYSISLSEVLFKHGETEKASGFLQNAKDLAKNLDDPIARDEINSMLARSKKRTLI